MKKSTQLFYYLFPQNNKGHLQKSHIKHNIWGQRRLPSKDKTQSSSLSTTKKTTTKKTQKQYNNNKNPITNGKRPDALPL
jgi:hypothetical protein